MKEVFAEMMAAVPSWAKYVMIAITAVIAAVIFLLARLDKNYKKDNPIEQLVEEAIKEETGLDINLSSQLSEPIK